MVVDDEDDHDEVDDVDVGHYSMLMLFVMTKYAECWCHVDWWWYRP